MGKVRRYRQKLHTTAVKLKKQDEQNKNSCSDNTVLNQTQNLPSNVSKGWFENIAISPDLLHQSLKDFDTKSLVSHCTTTPNKAISKKDKRKMRHQAFLEKLNASYTATKKSKKAKKRAKTPIIGDLKPLLEALPSLEQLLEDSLKQKDLQVIEPNKKWKKNRRLKIAKKKMSSMLSDVLKYQQVMAHPAYKVDPFATISEHLANTLKVEQMQK